MYKHILVPIDGSDTSRRGLREAIGLAALLKAKLRLLHVIGDFGIMGEMTSTIDFEKYHSGLLQWGRDLLEKTAAEGRAGGLEVSTELREPGGGRVADAIVEEAREARCDLIVIGTHGRRGFSHALMGSDAERVVRESSVPVLVVRASEAAE
jgi:nucleotide-binding universal stress UspA family protein